MKNSILFFLICMPVYLFPGIREAFSDGNFTENPVWNGTLTNFKVNSSFQLQSAASVATTSFLFTPSGAIENATWECKLNFDYSTSSTNYSCIYLISDVPDPVNGINGYFVQIGGTNDEISLYVQEGTRKTKIIDGTDKRTDGKNPEIFLKVTRDSTGIFRLYSRLLTETDYVKEGEAFHSGITKCNFFGLSFTNTASTGTCYYFDDIFVEGKEFTDKISPEWLGFDVVYPDEIRCAFSESVVYQQLKMKIDNHPVENLQVLTQNHDSLLILKTFDLPQKGKICQIELAGISDIAGNILKDSVKVYVAKEDIMAGDVVFNEVMFHQPDSSYEYVELINISDKLIDLSGMIITTRRSDGTLSTGIKIPEKTYISSYECIAFTQQPEIVRKYHHCPDSARIISTPWTNLNNESSTLVFVDNQKDIIYDEFTYDVSMHHVMIKNPQGVSLEKIFANIPSSDINNWHSASSQVLFGTPGYRNSQFRYETENIETESFWTESEYFTPDNDGVSDLFVVHYKMNAPGFIANVQVFQSSGEKVADLLKNSLMMSEGLISWDGSTDQNKTAVPGIYLMYIDSFHPMNGIRKTYKIPLVVSCR